MVGNLYRTFTEKLRKPLVFGLFGGTGCLVAATILGEVWLWLTHRPPGREPQAVVLAIDTSSSMSGGKLSEVQMAASGFVDRQDLKVHELGVVEFASSARILTNLNAEESEVQQAIANLQTSGTTNLDQGLNAATSVLGNTNLGANILLFTDGQPNNKARARSIARQIRQAGINLVAVGTGDAKVNYLISLTGDRDLVFYANSGEIDNAFRAAERVIYGQQLVESDRSGDYGLIFGIFRIGVWTGWLALGTAIALIVGQNRTLRRRLLTRREGLVGGGGGFLAGFTGGAVGQFAFLPTVYLPALSLVARLTGWTLLGTLVGGGMSLFVPNLPRDKALMAGAIGGILGAIGFLLLDAVVGVVLGRLAGAAILGFCIGLAIAAIEQLNREAVLWVRWTESEFTTISLGKKPIEIGSAQTAHVYLPKDGGFPEKFARLFVEEGKVILEFDPAIQQLPKYQNMKIFRQELPNGSRRQFGTVSLEIQQKN
ncbi:vWA domain-containing protein [Phormidium sp. CCY1219]|uniref:vWA domain-containing protein n=1 Tax=Phormidium sp. CCY1219 TaxID=2886104 RepID=UPI002D1EEB35|nr:vWA domain-containing protein [Phormidium sp. CCY1219]MEB3827024.1 VWA domain-containing protein [Phormidium sp. CCY1219]